jgi:signal transduction histidine kinase
MITLSFFAAKAYCIKVEVADTGIGIREENQKHLF